MTDTRESPKPQSKLQETWQGATVDKLVKVMADNPPPIKKPATCLLSSRDKNVEDIVTNLAGFQEPARTWNTSRLDLNTNGSVKPGRKKVYPGSIAIGWDNYPTLSAKLGRYRIGSNHSSR